MLALSLSYRFNLFRYEAEQAQKEAILERQKLSEIEKEISIAEIVQHGILTSDNYLNHLENISVEVFYLPQNKKVGGDYYNIFQINEDSIRWFSSLV